VNKYFPFNLVQQSQNMDKKKVIQLSDAMIYQRENLILGEVNLEVTAGEFIYVVGKVGTGKTSLIKTLHGELSLYEGTGEVLDIQLTDIKSRDLSILRRKMGVVFQDFRLLTDRNVGDNLAFVLEATGWKRKSEILERVIEVLDIVGMTDQKRQNAASTDRRGAATCWHRKGFIKRS